MSISALSNLVALLIAVVGYFLPGISGELTLSTGLYALSGGITNWLAIHMLFEKVPGFYGSGVIPARFEEFKKGIHHMIMQQFFNPENVRNFFSQNGSGATVSAELAEGIITRVDFNKAFDSLVEMILESSFGSMLGMFGGAKALSNLRQPFIDRMQDFLQGMAKDAELLDQIGKQSADSLLGKVENIVNKRLDELTPQMVKEIIEHMIHKHLGWLVVWGAVLGGIMGLVVEAVI
ncbi:MAG: DUF445 domain-containing protein [Pseudomonadota bacterium]